MYKNLEKLKNVSSPITNQIELKYQVLHFVFSGLEQQ